MKRLKLIEFGGFPGSGKSYMADKISLGIKEKNGYYPAPIYEWNTILKNLPVLEDSKIQSNFLKKISFRIYKRYGMDLFGWMGKLSKGLCDQVKMKYDGFHLDIEDFERNSTHSKDHPKDSRELCDYLRKLIQYYFYLENNTSWECLILSEGFCKHSIHIINHQEKNIEMKKHFLEGMPKIDAFFYLDVNINTALSRKKDRNSFYKDHSYDDVLKSFHQSKELNLRQIRRLEEIGIPVFIVNNEDFETSFDFVSNKIKEILIKN